MFGKSVFIVAELSANHNNDFDLTVKTIKAIADSGADAVKVQTYKPGSITLNLSTGYFSARKDGLWKGYTPWQLFKKAAMPYEWQVQLKKIAEDSGLIFFSSPFDTEAVDFLETLKVAIYKIASFEITDIPLIEYIASKGKPVIISTGVADIDDIQLAIDTCRNAGNNKIFLLKCTSEYPATINKANLLTIPDMKNRFEVEVGVSDHSCGIIVPLVAVSLGARIVEKHFILDRNMGGIDSAFSMEPDEFKEMVQKIRQAETAIGNINYEVRESDKYRRRSLFVIKNIRKGECISDQNIKSIRPGYGLPPKYFNSVLGKKVKRDLRIGSPLKEEDIDEFIR